MVAEFLVIIGRWLLVVDISMHTKASCLSHVLQFGCDIQSKSTYELFAIMI